MIKFTLDKVLEEKGYSIKDIAALTNLSRTTISNLVNNYAKGIQLDTLEKLADVLGVDITDIIYYYPNPAFEEIKVRFTNLNRMNEEEYEYQEHKVAHIKSILPINIDIRNLKPIMDITFSWEIEVEREIEENQILSVIIRLPDFYERAFQILSLEQYSKRRVLDTLAGFILKEISILDTSELLEEYSITVEENNIFVKNKHKI